MRSLNTSALPEKHPPAPTLITNASKSLIRSSISSAILWYPALLSGLLNWSVQKVPGSLESSLALAIIFWIASFAGLALALIALWLLIVYGAKIIVVYLAAGWVLGKIFQRQIIWLDILAILAGSAVYLLLRSIPFLGWVIGVLVTAAGAGCAWLAYRESRRKPSVPASTETAGRSKKPAAKISA